MPNRNSPIYRGLNHICRVLTLLAMLMLALMTVLVVGQVILRNFFDLGLPWADELSRISNIALVFFVAPALMLHNRHIAIDLLYSALRPRGKAILRVANYILITAFSGVFLFSLYTFLLRAGKFSTPSMGLSNLVVYAPAVIGIVLLTAVAIYRLVTDSEPAAHHEEADSPDDTDNAATFAASREEPRP
ncbi:TRAP transporter small permease [Thalassospira australica]|uniref:TRAP transporter small permease n=1 Tax=Thalassospira australica TaxID=1528106 RepID=UPI00384F202C